jgi:hypothetical protein
MYQKRNVNRRNTSIFEDYKELFFTNLLREEVIWQQLGEKYFLSPTVVRRIVGVKKKELQNSQPELPIKKEDL